jgi:putative ABC transport system ATP-binding protein
MLYAIGIILEINSIKTEKMIKTIGLKKIFRTDDIETTAISEINLEIKSGEFVAITGPSGCGKSTLLNLLGMLDKPSGGEYYFNDEQIAGYSEKQRAVLRKNNIGFIFQSFNLVNELTVFENVELPLLYTNIAKAERKLRVESLLDQMNMLHRMKHYPQQLSGGQQQRVAICRAISNSPKLILADEPTGNLDSKHGDEVIKLLMDLNAQGTTIAMVTHSKHYANFCGRIIHLLDGNIITENLRKEIYA